VKISELATVYSYPWLLQTPLKRGGATLQLCQISLPLFIKITSYFFSSIPHRPKNKFSYSNGHVHIHESVVRFMKHTWTTLPHISVAVLWNVRSGSLNFQVEEHEDRGKSFFETLVLTYQTWLKGVTCEKSVIIVNFTKARKCLYQNDTALNDRIKIQIGRVHITWHCGAFVLET
jgi:hypothetical protein